MNRCCQLFFLLSFITFNFANAQSPALQEAYANKYTALQQGDTAKVLDYAHEIIELINVEFPTGGETFVSYAFDLSTTFQQIGAYEESATWYLNTAIQYKLLYGDDHEYVGITLYNLGGVYEFMNDFEKATEYYDQAFDMLLKRLGASHEYTKLVVTSQKNLFNRISDFQSLLKVLEHELAATGQTFGSKSLEYGLSLNEYALAYYNLEKYDEAIKYYQQAQSVVYEVEGESENYTGITYNLAYAFLAANQYQEAADLLSYYLNYLRSQENYDSLDFEYNNLQYYLGYSYYNIGNYASASQPFENYQKYLFAKDPTNFVELTNVMFHLSDTYRQLNRYEQSEESFLSCLDLVKDKQPELDHMVVNLHNSLGLLYKEMAQYSASENHLSQALSLNEGQDKALEQTILNNYGLLKMDLGLYEEAEKLFQQAIKLKKHVTLGDQSIVQNNLGLLYFYSGVFSKAETYLDKSLETKAQFYGKDHPFYATTLLNVANNETSLGDFYTAKEKYIKAYHIYFNSLGYYSEYVANTLHNLGELYLGIGQKEKSILFYTYAFNIRDSILNESHPKLAISHNGLALGYRYLGDTAQALFHYQKALEIRKESLPPDHKDIKISIMNLAELYDVMGNSDKSIEILKGIENSFNDTDNYLYATFLNNYAGVLLKTNDIEKAIAFYERSTKLRSKIYGKQHTLYAEVLSNLSTAYEAAGKVKEAFEVFYTSNEILKERINSVYPYLSEKDKAKFYQTISSAFTAFNSFAISYHDQIPTLWNDVLDNQLALKGMILETSKQIRTYVLNSGDSILINNYQDWLVQKERLAHLYTLDQSTLDKRDIDLAYEENLANQLESELTALSSTINSSKSNSWKDVKSSLEDGEIALELIQSEIYQNGKWTDSTAYIALLLTNDIESPEAVILSNGDELEKKAFSLYSASVRFKTTDKQSYIKYWAPIQERIDSLGTFKKLYVSNDGVYHKVNLQGLLNPGTNKYLGEDLEVQLISSTRNLISKTSSNVQRVIGSDLNAILFGYPDYEARLYTPAFDSLFSQGSPHRGTAETGTRATFKFEKVSELPGTKEEVELINQLLTGKGIQTEVYLGKDASESTLKSIKQPGILHIASHGFFLPQPKAEFGIIGDAEGNKLSSSGIILAGHNYILQNQIESEQDGIMTALEFSNLNLQGTKLVVLSACETGLGEIVSGEGVFGLQRAFQLAGTEAIVMSLWKVSDEATSELMISFYANMLSGQTTRQAFRNAQLSLKAKYEDPFYWAAFVYLE